MLLLLLSHLLVALGDHVVQELLLLCLVLGVLLATITRSTQVYTDRWNVAPLIRLRLVHLLLLLRIHICSLTLEVYNYLSLL